MAFKSILGAASIFLTVASLNANAVIINTLNGVDYEWLELSETQGLSRDEVELRLADTNDALYGYEYASRTLVEELLISYAPYDGLDGYHGDSTIISGIQGFFSDFGSTRDRRANLGSYQYNTVDGYTVTYESGNDDVISAFYGSSGECDASLLDSCRLYTAILYDDLYNPVMALKRGDRGFDATATNPLTMQVSDFSDDNASLLVRSTVVPVPAAVWLFGSGLIGLVGFARRKKA